MLEIAILVVILFTMKMTLELCLRLKQPQLQEAKGLQVETIPYHQTTSQVKDNLLISHFQRSALIIVGEGIPNHSILKYDFLGGRYINF